ncbi:MAG TPA: hypothetical protein PLO78_05015 [Candidatus Omnitrophota bacterium]|nr:hypothetical protein [Candidatus Omnitrophota bacterium]
MIINKKKKSEITFCLVLIFFIVPPALATENYQERKDSKEQIPANILWIGINDKQQEGLKKVTMKSQPRWAAEDRAIQLEKEGNIDEAIAEFNRAIQVSENSFYSWTSHYALARLYQSKGAFNDAVKEINWLIKNCQSEETKKELFDKKQKLLGQT